MCDLEICWMTLKNNRAPLLCYFKLCASFHSHQSIQTGDIVWKCLIRVTISNFLSCVTLKFHRWPWKTIGHLFYTTSSFVHHFIAISPFKLELHSGNDQFRSKSAIFCPVWPWNLTDDPEKQYGISTMPHQALCIISSPYVNSNWSYGLESAKLAFDLCDLDLWLLTLIFCMDITSRKGNNSWKFEWWEHSGKGLTDGRTDRRTELFIELIGRSKNVWILSKITLKYFPKGPINNIPALV